MGRTILHADCNNFYASVECLYNPALRGKPVAVAGDPEQRHGIVLAKNYLAKACGIQTGNPLWLAKQLCPEIVFVPPHYDKYLRFSRIAREIYNEYTDQVEPFGLDEAWLDVTGSGIMGTGEQIANEIRKRIKQELGITVSVGVSFNKVFAKLGSDIKKPDATTIITPENFREMVWTLPVSDLLYVGPATTRKLNSFAIHTIGDLASAPDEWLKSKLGKIGFMLKIFAQGKDTSPVSVAGTPPKIKSIGNSMTTPRDLVTDEEMKITMLVLAESVAERMRGCFFRAGTVEVSLRDNELSYCTRQKKLSYPTGNSEDIFKAAFKLYKENHISGKPLRSIGIRACDLSMEKEVQLSLFPGVIRTQKIDRLETAVDSIRSRFGHFAIRRAVMLTDPILSDTNPAAEHTIHPVSFL